MLAFTNQIERPRSSVRSTSTPHTSSDPLARGPERVTVSSTMSQTFGTTSLTSCSKWLNIFQYCRFLRILGHVMVLLVLALVGLIYTAVVPLTFGPFLLSKNIFVILASVIVILVYSVVVSKLLHVKALPILSPRSTPLAHALHGRSL